MADFSNNASYKGKSNADYKNATYNKGKKTYKKDFGAGTLVMAAATGGSNIVGKFASKAAGGNRAAGEAAKDAVDAASSWW